MNASYANGIMILRPNVSVDQLVQEWKDAEDDSKKKYATFKIIDWKNQHQIETSCGPSYLPNYFEKSNKPFEISPAFFRPEVLTRFKNDPEKYDLEDRSIGCRNAWYLKTYDINEAGQVHTYIGYLAKLPYEEQLYRQSFNEWPKAPISKRAYENDFEGNWSSDYDPLQALKRKIRQLDDNPPAWWKARGDELINAVRYPATDLEPLARLHKLRSILKGHGAPSERAAASKSARKDHGTLREHFSALASQCDAAFIAVLKAFGTTIKLD